MSKLSDQLASILAKINDGTITPANCEGFGIDRGHYFHLLAIASSSGGGGGGTVAIDQTTPGTTNKVDTVKQGTATNRSGTITLGGTAQNIAGALAGRRYFSFQNISDTDMWINGNATAAVGVGLKIVAGASYENPPHFCPSGALSVFCATTGKAYTAEEA